MAPHPNIQLFELLALTLDLQGSSKGLDDARRRARK
jgi:hypothetical protein